MRGDEHSNGNQSNGNHHGNHTMPRVEIDVRPALDTPGALVQRGTRLLREAFPGIAREWDEQRAKTTQPCTEVRHGKHH